MKAKQFNDKVHQIAVSNWDFDRVSDNPHAPVKGPWQEATTGERFLYLARARSIATNLFGTPEEEFDPISIEYYVADLEQVLDLIDGGRVTNENEFLIESLRQVTEALAEIVTELLALRRENLNENDDLVVWIENTLQKALYPEKDKEDNGTAEE